MVKALFSPCTVRVQKGSSKKNEKSKNFFENPGCFRKKSDYIGEGAFPPSFTFVDGEENFLKNFQNALQNFAKKGTYMVKALFRRLKVGVCR